MIKKIYNKLNIKIILLIFLGLLSFYFLFTKIWDTDYFWHLKVGEWMFDNHKIPVQDIFGWYGTEFKLDWFSHEWLSEVIIYGIYFLFNHLGIEIFVVLSIIILFYLLYKTSKNPFNNILFTSVWFIFMLFEFYKVASPRPHIFSYYLLFITMYILNKYKESNTKLIYTLPLLSIIWVNLHGGSFILVILLPALLIVSSLFNIEIGLVKSNTLDKNKIVELLKVVFLSILGAMINPKGYRMLLYPIENMKDTLMLSTISEWRCPDLKNSGDIIIFLSIFIVFAILFILNKNRKSIDLFEFLIIGAFTYLTLKSIRFMPMFFIVATPYIYKYLDKFIIINFKDIDILKPILILLCCIVTTSIGFSINKFLKEPIKSSYLPSSESFEIIKNENPKRLLNDYTWGGYLIYNNIPVFIDGRADMYSGHNFDEYVSLYRAKKDTPELINKYNFDYMYLLPEDQLSTYMKEREDYSLIFQDDTAVIFKKLLK